MSDTDSRRKPYPFDEIEPKWQSRWADAEAFRTANPGDADFDPAKPKFYVLDMFPYPSGTGLHVGHAEGETATDIVARYKRARGFNVLHPMGWDAFGLPAEQHAIKTGEHPSVSTRRNTDNYRRQLQALGFSYDWEREVDTTDPGYVRWTQWIFLKLYNSYFDPRSNRARPVAELEASGWSRAEIDAARLAYIAEVPVNWSPDLGTVLANEEVEEWRAKGHTVERRPLRQWMLRITAYAERLLDGLDTLDWSEGVKALQRNWIGRSEGAEVIFQIADFAEKITVFTTRPDTLFGATYMVLAPEHPLVESITTPENRAAVSSYISACSAKSDLERTDLAKDKTGTPTGAHAINPVNNERIPIWIADYVLLGYGTGAIMAVPAHDDRDFEFAKKFGLDIRQVVSGGELPFTATGTNQNSTNPEISLDGLPTTEAQEKITAWLEGKGLGKKTTTYKLRDWLFSRQRYWGEPFPIVWDADGNHHALPESELPLLAPHLDDYHPSGRPEALLAKAPPDWLRYESPDGQIFTRETNTMPQWAGSCWYYLRFCDAQNGDFLCSPEAEKYWMSVDLYIGGTEHAVLHLLYARFWHMALHDLGHVSTPEPFRRLVNQGMILGEDGQKMSKSRGNVINPDDVVREFGADSLRLYEMFMGPLEQVKPWNTKGVAGVHRFLARVWRLAMDSAQDGQWRLSEKITNDPPDAKTAKLLHATIKKVGDDIEALRFNTAISALMELCNHLTTLEKRPRHALATLLRLLEPFAPHIAEELFFSIQKSDELLTHRPWPEYDEKYLVEDEMELPVQVNGKLRGKITIPADAERAEIEAAALAAPNAAKHTAGKTVRKIIVVPGRLVNIVAT